MLVSSRKKMRAGRPGRRSSLATIDSRSSLTTSRFRVLSRANFHNVGLNPPRDDRSCFSLAASTNDFVNTTTSWSITLKEAPPRFAIWSSFAAMTSSPRLAGGDAITPETPSPPGRVREPFRCGGSRRFFVFARDHVPGGVGSLSQPCPSAASTKTTSGLDEQE